MANDGLEWMLELDAKLDGALKMVRALDQGDEALKKMNEALKKVEQSSGHGSAGHQKYGASVQKTEGILHHFMSATLGPLEHHIARIAEFVFIRRGVEALIDMPKEALHWFKELAEEMVNAAAKAERVDKSFALLLGTDKGKETIEWIEKVSKYTEFTDDQLKGMAAGLAKAGFEGRALTRALAASVDMAAFSGSGAAGGDAAVHALEMIKTKGEVSARALMALGIEKKAFDQALADRLGMTPSKGYIDEMGTVHKPFENLTKKIEAGQVDTQEMIETLNTMITKRTGKDLGGAGVEMSKTLEARLTHLKDLPEQFFQKFRTTGAYSRLSEGIGSVLEKLDPDGPTGERIFVALEKATLRVSAFFNDIDIDQVISRGIRVLEQMPGVVRDVVTVFRELLDVVSSVFSVIGKSISILHDYTPLGTVYDFAESRRKQIEAGQDAADAAGAPLVDPNRSWTDKYTPVGFFKDMFGSGTNGAKGFAGGVGAGGPMAEESGFNLGGSAIDGLSKKLVLHSPSKVFERMGELTGDGFNQGIEKSMAGTDNVMRGAFAVPTPGGAGGALGGNVTVDVGGIHLHVAGGTSQEIAEEAIEHLKEAAPGIFQSAIERLALQAGGI